MQRSLYIAITLTILIFGASLLKAKPLKVFILAGQSNMEGHAKVSTFDYIGLDPKTAPLLKDMRNEDGTPKIFKDIPISYLTGLKKDEVKSGPLTVGYGSLQNGPKIGPEYTFGIYLHKQLKEPILLIKTAWGGKSLNTDFRPPSAGPYVLNDHQKELYKKQKKDLTKWQADKDKVTGHYYRLMIDHVRKVLKNIKKVYPDYDPKQGYELAGFVWFQGWNDMCDSHTYPDRKKAGGFDEYSRLLAQFIRDVRKDLNAPKLPFVIGVLGVDGTQPDNEFRKAMAAPAKMDEFKGSVTAVRTGQFWDHGLGTVLPKRGQLNKFLGRAHQLDKQGVMISKKNGLPGWESIGKPSPEERIWHFISLNPTVKKEKMPVGDAKRFRSITLPENLKNWFKTDFDDSNWKTGKAPIGFGVWKRHGITVKNNSDWGDGEFLLARTTFEVDKLDYEAYRISVLARQGFDIYLNGNLIHRYIWWQNDAFYRSIILSDNEIKHLKKGPNILAVYANYNIDKRNPKPYASIDVDIEGITKAGQKQVQKEIDQIISPREREIARGASNAGYHYLGSAKILAQIGKAFAEAMAELQKN